MKEIILFDFDRTLTRTDTLKFFIILIVILHPIAGVRILKYLLFSMFNRTRDGGFRGKAVHLVVKDFPEKKLAMVAYVFHWVVKFYVNKPVFDHLNKCIESGKQVIIVTASPKIIVERVFKNLNLDVLGSEFSTIQGRLTGMYVGVRCYGDEKVSKLREYFSKLDCEYVIQECWSDSVEDLPMMKLAKRKIWVVPNDRETVDGVMLESGSIFRS